MPFRRLRLIGVWYTSSFHHSCSILRAPAHVKYPLEQSCFENLVRSLTIPGRKYIIDSCSLWPSGISVRGSDTRPKEDVGLDRARPCGVSTLVAQTGLTQGEIP